MIYMSKSKYTRALQCPKMLWMDSFKPELADDSAAAVFVVGNEVGDLAREYFGNYVLADFDAGFESMIEQTRAFMEQGAENIAEASFSVDGLFCSVDILHKTPTGWDLVEVKSSTGLKDTYLDDMAFQYFVLTQCGVRVSGVYNLHINRDYVRRGDLDLHGLFTKEDCTERVLRKQAQVAINIADIRRYMAMCDDFEPERDIGPWCESPYKCTYYGYCSRHLPENNVFDLQRFAKDKQFDLYYRGIVSYEDILAHDVKLNKAQLLQVKSAVEHLPPHIDKKGIRGFLAQLTYPLYHLDFETYQPPVPQHEGERPYIQVPFQYSLHIQRAPGAEPEHREHLGIAGTDPRRALAEQLCRDIPKDVCSLAYYMQFEKSVIRALAEQFPDLADHLMNIHDHMKDLMLPFQKRYYYSEAMGKSYSIKYVLPALYPNEPSLDYHNLEGIHHGGEAMAAFPDLPNHTPEEQAIIRKNLLAYCGLDTYAMVKVLEKLYEVSE